MKFTFIGGVPTAGKSYLADKLSKERQLTHVDIDEWRDEMKRDPNLEPWANFFWNKDEGAYWQKTGCEEHWENLRKQSEALWPTIKRHVDEIMAKGQPAIFEGVSIFPHLAAQDFPFQGVYMLGESLESTFERIKEKPRWGRTEELWRKEAEIFYRCEGPLYEKEAKKHGFKSFTSIEEAERESF